MASVNRVHILGNVGRDPELRYTPSGTAVCSLSVATSRSWKNKDSGEKQEETEWHRIAFYDRLAEIAGEYLRKGSSVYVEGRLKTRKWQDKDGKDQYTTEVIAEQMQLLGGREQQEERQPSPQKQQKPAARTQKPMSKVAGDGDDSDIPFADPLARGRALLV